MALKMETDISGDVVIPCAALDALCLAMRPLLSVKE
jgi:hypothetical protein